MKNIKNFHLKINIFTAVKYCCILHGRVFVITLSCDANSDLWELEQLKFVPETLLLSLE